MIRTVFSEEDLFSLFRNWNMDGLILIGAFKDKFFEKLIDAKVPLVLIDSYVDNKKILNIGIEDYEAGYMATKYLLEKGHRDIVFASPIIRKGGVVEERFKGYKKALEEFNIHFEEKNVYEQEITITEGIELGHRLSKRKDITAVFATADILAAGVITGLDEKGKGFQKIFLLSDLTIYI